MSVLTIYIGFLWRQAGWDSPIQFSTYGCTSRDKLLMKLLCLEVGCYWDYHFAGTLALSG